MKRYKAPRPRTLSQRAPAVEAKIGVPEKAAKKTWLSMQWLRDHPAVVFIGFFFPAIIFMFDLSNKRQESYKAAWETLSQDNIGGSAKRDALQYLNSEYGCLPRGISLPWIGRCWKERNSLSGIDLSQPVGKAGTFLREVDLSEANLRGANLSRADLSAANLSNADLLTANLSEAVLAGADLIGANVSASELHRANLTGARLAGAQLDNTDLTDANLANANLTSTSLTGSVLRGANLENANLTAADLSGADLGVARWSFANLQAANLSSADVTGAVFQIEVDFTGAWTFEGAPAEDNIADTFYDLAARQSEEPWPVFVDRIMRERPELDWTENMKDRNPD